MTNVTSTEVWFRVTNVTGMICGDSKCNTSFVEIKIIQTIVNEEDRKIEVVNYLHGVQ